MSINKYKIFPDATAERDRPYYSETDFVQATEVTQLERIIDMVLDGLKRKLTQLGTDALQPYAHLEQAPPSFFGRTQLEQLVCNEIYRVLQQRFRSSLGSITAGRLFACIIILEDKDDLRWRIETHRFGAASRHELKELLTGFTLRNQRKACVPLLRRVEEMLDVIDRRKEVLQKA